MEQQITAANGATILFYKMPNTHSVCISLYVKAGVLYENAHNGISHFLEHLHFRKLGGRSQRDLYRELESLGAIFGAGTYKEFLHFYLISSPKYFAELAKFAADLLGSLEVNEQDVKAEKRLIISELREDDPQNDINYISDKYIWEGTTLQNPILGTVPSIKGLTLAALQDEKEKIFTKDNLFFYVTGCFDDQEINILRQEVDRYDLSQRPKAENNNAAQIPVNFMQRKAFVKVFQRKFYMHEVKISFDFDLAEISRHELLYLDSILSDGLCSLLRTELIEKRGLIYSFNSTIEQYNNIGVYYFTFTVHKSKLYESVKSFISVIKRVKSGISEETLKTTRVFKTDNQALRLDDPDGLNWMFAYENHILKKTFLDVQELAALYEGITSERLVQTANKLFVRNNIMLISLGNKKGLSEIKLQKLLLEL